MRFGLAWVAFALSLGVHVADEAARDFLSVYNPSARMIRQALPFLPVPVFRFDVWLGGLIAAILLLLALAPLAFRGNRALRRIALPLGLVVGVFNAFCHIGGSLYLGRLMPGTLSAPLILAAGLWLIFEARRAATQS
ncbi:MAG: hypothetical protein P4L57_05445 [Rhizomicrobium sp.]|nr:hypothetical protein [Rhizomicrobium sp.]